MKVIFNEERARIVFRRLDAYWKSQKGIFRSEYLPENMRPFKDTPRRTANYLFYASIFMRGGVNSNDPFRILEEMRNKHPEVFEPRVIVRAWTEEKLTRLFIETASRLHVTLKHDRRERLTGAGSASANLEQHVKHWHHNSLVLARDWNGNVLTVFKGVSDFEEAFSRIDYRQTELPRNGYIPNLRSRLLGFKGIRRKIFSLFTIWLQTKGYIPKFPTPIPVDFHALRILWATGVISFSNSKKFEPKPDSRLVKLAGYQFVETKESLTDQIAIWSQKFLPSIGLSHMTINPALWVLSRQMCAWHPQNTSLDGGTDFLFKEDLVDPGRWPKNYPDPCSHCRLSEFCGFAIPATPYYLQRLLVLIPKADYPQRNLPLKTDGIMANGRKNNLRGKGGSPVSQVPSNDQDALFEYKRKTPTS